MKISGGYNHNIISLRSSFFVAFFVLEVDKQNEFVHIAGEKKIVFADFSQNADVRQRSRRYHILNEMYQIY